MTISTDYEDFRLDIIDLLRTWTVAAEKMPKCKERSDIVYTLAMISATARIFLASEEDDDA